MKAGGGKGRDGSRVKLRNKWKNVEIKPGMQNSAAITVIKRWSMSIVASLIPTEIRFCSVCCVIKIKSK